MTTPVPFATDQPIGSSRDDQFGRKQFAERVAHTIAHRSDPSSIVIGLYGAWGEGKTSVLRMIDEALTAEPDVKTFWFNPWRYRDEDTLLEQFFRSMAAAMGSSLASKSEELGGLLRKYKYLVAPVLAIGGTMAKNLAGVPGIAAEVATVTGGQVDDFAAGLADVDAETLKERIDRRLAEETARLVVFMDDLDRLDQQEIQAVFRLVKLTLSFSNTAFVLAFDEEVVEQALTPQFGAASGKFLEKIIQVPLQLPRIDRLILRKFCFAAVDEALGLADIDLPSEDVRRFVQVFDAAILPRLVTPRIARRCGNTLAFALPLLKGEVDAVDLMLIEAIRVFYPRLYASIRQNRDVYVWSVEDHLARRDKNFGEKKRATILAAVDGLPEAERDAALAAVTALFPRNASLLAGHGGTHSNHGTDARDTEKRIASPDYFDRYFGYGIPPNDISDAEFSRFVATLQAGRTPHEIGADMERLCAGGRTERFLEKAWLASKTFPSDQCGPLALAIATNAALFPRDTSSGGFGFGNLRQDASLRVYWLIQRIPLDERFAMMSACVRSAPDPMFAVELTRWCATDEGEAGRSFPPEQQVTMRSLAVAKIRSAIVDAPPWSVFGRETASALWTWADVDGKEVTSEYLMARFAKEPREVLPFLESMLRNAKQVSSGRPVRRAFSEQDYEAVCAVTDPERIAEIVRGLGYQAEAGPRYEQPEGPPEEQTARRFLAMHQAAQDSGAASHVSAPP